MSEKYYMVCCICHGVIVPGQNPILHHWDDTTAIYCHEHCEGGKE